MSAGGRQSAGGTGAGDLLLDPDFGTFVPQFVLHFVEIGPDWIKGKTKAPGSSTGQLPLSVVSSESALASGWFAVILHGNQNLEFGRTI